MRRGLWSAVSKGVQAGGALAAGVVAVEQPGAGPTGDTACDAATLLAWSAAPPTTACLAAARRGRGPVRALRRGRLHPLGRERIAELPT